jgi:hypothetical protein
MPLFSFYDKCGQLETGVWRHGDQECRLCMTSLNRTAGSGADAVKTPSVRVREERKKERKKERTQRQRHTLTVLRSYFTGHLTSSPHLPFCLSTCSRNRTT